MDALGISLIGYNSPTSQTTSTTVSSVNTTKSPFHGLARKIKYRFSSGPVDLLSLSRRQKYFRINLLLHVKIAYVYVWIASTFKSSGGPRVEKLEPQTKAKNKRHFASPFEQLDPRLTVPSLSEMIRTKKGDPSSMLSWGSIMKIIHGDGLMQLVQPREHHFNQSSSATTTTSFTR